MRNEIRVERGELWLIIILADFWLYGLPALPDQISMPLRPKAIIFAAVFPSRQFPQIFTVREYYVLPRNSKSHQLRG